MATIRSTSADATRNGAWNSDQGAGRQFFDRESSPRSRELAERRDHPGERTGGGQEQAERIRPEQTEAPVEVARRGCATGNLVRQRRSARRQDVCAPGKLEGDISRRTIDQEGDREKGDRISRQEINRLNYRASLAGCAEDGHRRDGATEKRRSLGNCEAIARAR